MKILQIKNYSVSFIVLLLLVVLLAAGCKQNENTSSDSGKHSALSILLDKELDYLQNNKDRIKIYQNISINGQSEEKQQEIETVKQAIQTLKEMDIDRMMVNISFQKTSQDLTNSRKTNILEENYILKAGEKSPVKRLSIYYINPAKRPGDIIGFYILKSSVNRLFSSRQSHYLRFKNQHLQRLEMNGIQKIIFSDPIKFKSVIEIRN